MTLLLSLEGGFPGTLLIKPQREAESQSDLPRTVILHLHKPFLALGRYCRTGMECVWTQWQLEGDHRDCVYQQQLDARDQLLLRIEEGQNHEQGECCNTGNSQSLVYLIILMCQTNQQEGRSTQKHLHLQDGGQMSTALGMHVSPVESGKS